jgi:hypothetical protein
MTAYDSCQMNNAAPGVKRTAASMKKPAEPRQLLGFGIVAALGKPGGKYPVRRHSQQLALRILLPLA